MDENKLMDYFDELMATEIECALQELHSRPQRPWIVMYLTHPSLFNERKGKVFNLAAYSRILKVLNSYKIDLLLLCEASELLSAFKETKNLSKDLDNINIQHEMKLPTYLQTTLVECPTTNNTKNNHNCNYAVLNIDDRTIKYSKKSLIGDVLLEASIQKNTKEEKIPMNEC
uniref:Uncharacterized protein n=1 Tax=Ditylenchus dipsaci TaxID=166011 RepID=A0A915DW28_9BILA